MDKKSIQSTMLDLEAKMGMLRKELSRLETIYLKNEGVLEYLMSQEPKEGETNEK